MLRVPAVVLALLAATTAATVRSAHNSPVAGPIPFHYQLYTFRGDAGRTVVVAAVAVPAARLERDYEARAVRYGFDVTLVLADTVRRTVVRTDDSVFVRMPRPLAGEHLLYTHVEVQAPPSATTRQRVILIDATTPGRGQLYTSRFPVPDYRGSHLMLSDVALSQPDAQGGWKRGNATLALLPTSQFRGSVFDVYYEVYNLPHGHPYTTEIAVDRVDGRRRGDPDSDAVRLHFAGESAAHSDRVVQELRRVEASVSDGHYRITVTVTDELTGATASRAREFEVLRRRAGALLVVALPR